MLTRYVYDNVEIVDDNQMHLHLTKFNSRLMCQNNTEYIAWLRGLMGTPEAHSMGGTT
jgi:hypothetical protein